MTFVKSMGSPLLKQLGMEIPMETSKAMAIPVQDDVPSSDALVVFTDGSALANGRKGARAGYAVVWPDNEAMTVCEAVPKDEPQTNNRAEYRAAHKAFLQAKSLDSSGMRTLYIYTDSQLLINSMTKWLAKWKHNGWKTAKGEPVEHQDLLKEIDFMSQMRRVKWIHVDAHTGGTDWKSKWNDKADELAKNAASQR